MPEHNRSLLPHARAMRKSMTKEESHLWYDFLRYYPIRFRRQEIIGHYIGDFYCSKARLIVEVDGSQHYDAEEHVEYDEKRTAFLKSLDIDVIRFTNIDVKRYVDGVCQTIDSAVRKRMERKPLSQLR